MTESDVAVVAHGGAGKWRTDKRPDALQGLESAIGNGVNMLESGGSALNVAETIVNFLEDNPTFNAGTGSSLNLDGEIEMDASIMDGSRRHVGAVTAISDVKNPVSVARKVMEETDHVMLTGDGALRFAREFGFESYDCVTDESRKKYDKKLRDIQDGTKRYSFPNLPDLLEEHPHLKKGTVGAVVRDHEGHYAAATSTGGLILKLVGRVGDTPLPGAGTYATETAAASATGQGELVMRMLSTHRICQLIQNGLRADEAVQRCIVEMKETLGGADAGFIAVGSNGETVALHDSPHMPYARYESGMDSPEVELENKYKHSNG
jgi:beta-aspartyl-peptidase (threonine type)